MSRLIHQTLRGTYEPLIRMFGCIMCGDPNIRCLYLRSAAGVIDFPLNRKHVPDEVGFIDLIAMADTVRISTSTAPYIGLPPVCITLLEAKAKTGLSFADIAKSLGKDEVFVAAAFYGQAKLSAEELRNIGQTLGVDTSELLAQIGPHWTPHRTLGPIPPTDPVIYRLYEGVLVYGQPIKALIHEKFGDGIMSMIDCKIHIDKKPDPKGDRVLLTFDGKFLPYAQW